MTIKLGPTEIDAYGVVMIGTWGGYLVQIMPMIYNDRLVLTPAYNTNIVDYGWCYPRGAAAYLAAMQWDPETEAEPVGYIKAIRAGRRAGQCAEDWSYEQCIGCNKEFMAGYICRTHLLCGLCHEGVPLNAPPHGSADESISDDRPE